MKDDMVLFIKVEDWEYLSSFVKVMVLKSIKSYGPEFEGALCSLISTCNPLFLRF